MDTYDLPPYEHKCALLRLDTLVNLHDHWYVRFNFDPKPVYESPETDFVDLFVLTVSKCHLEFVTSFSTIIFSYCTRV
jgi:hypothetical protein